MPSFQGVIDGVREHWRREGCTWLTPLDSPMPAEALHPETFVRLVRPGAWRGAVVQTISRPADGRPGAHPYRLARVHQLQVALQGGREDPRRLLLDSLAAAGLELSKHDVRWLDRGREVPLLRAEAVGWRVKVDGLAVVDVALLQHLAERVLEPVALVFTYGLERLAMVVEGVTSAAGLTWSEEAGTYGELRHREEEELAIHAREVAEPEAWRRRLDEERRDAERCLEAGLVRLAYAALLRGLHAVEVLESRGALAPGERRRLLRDLGTLVVAAAHRAREGAPAVPREEGAGAAG